jgi:hypothetical protein
MAGKSVGWRVWDEADGVGFITSQRPSMHHAPCTKAAHDKTEGFVTGFDRF